MKAVIMVGVPGSGKSTKAKELNKKFKGTILSLDTLRKTYLGDESIQDPSIFPIFKRKLNEITEQKADIIIDNTSIRRRDRKALLMLFMQKGYKVCYHIMDTPLKECLRRNATRERIVPEEVILNMWQILEDNPPDLEKEKYEVSEKIKANSSR